MAPDKTETSTVKLTNTKKEILEAYETLLTKFNDQARAGFQAKDAQQKKKEEEIVDVADEAQKDEVITEIIGLKDSVAKTLSGLADKLTQENKRYATVQQAIDIKNKEIKELFDIETTLFSLAALIEAQKLKKMEFEEEMAREKEMLKAEIREAREQWAKDKNIHAQELKEQKAAEEKLRLREKEEYEYTINRQKEVKAQELHDLLEKSEKELQVKKETFEKENAQKIEDFKQREIAISEKEKRFAELQKQVDEFPELLKARIEAEVSEAVARLERDTQKNEELLRKDFEGQKNVLSTKIESLEKLVAGQQSQIKTLTSQLDDAYGKVQDIAVKAVYRQPEQQTRYHHKDDPGKHE